MAERDTCALRSISNKGKKPLHYILAYAITNMTFFRRHKFKIHSLLSKSLDGEANYSKERELAPP